MWNYLPIAEDDRRLTADALTCSVAMATSEQYDGADGDVATRQ